MRHSTRFSFTAKPVAALLLVGAADWLVDGWKIGSWLGLFALGWLATLLLVRPAARCGAALVAAGAAAAFAGALAWDPGLLAWTLFWAALSLAALLPRARFDDAARWAVRLLVHGMTGPAALPHAAARFGRVRPRGARRSAAGFVSLLALPLAMTAVFVALFAGANPLIAAALAAIRLPSPGEVVFWIAALSAVWPSLRPARWTARLGGTAVAALPSLSLDSLTISLLLFNAVFAVENALDLAFLWSGAPLPPGVTLAGYAHRGAYPLIATALLAAAFVLLAFQPGSAAAARPAIRRLVTAWVAQNVLLVASSILRTADYVAAYGLTALRVEALAWMGLVAVGLALIGWRLLAERSARWLINAGALAAALVLAAFTAVDADAVAARWNVEQARDAGGRVPLDLCQLNRLGAPALLPLLDLEARPLPHGLRDRVRAVRDTILWGGNGSDARPLGLVETQADWRTWTWRGARRLAAARERLGSQPYAPAALAAGGTWNCDGSVARPAPPTDASPLTGAPPR